MSHFASLGPASEYWAELRPEGWCDDELCLIARAESVFRAAGHEATVSWVGFGGDGRLWRAHRSALAECARCGEAVEYHEFNWAGEGVPEDQIVPVWKEDDWRPATDDWAKVGPCPGRKS